MRLGWGFDNKLGLNWGLAELGNIADIEFSVVVVGGGGGVKSFSCKTQT